MTAKILAHIMYIKKYIKGLSQSKFVFIIENNLPYISPLVCSSILKQLKENQAEFDHTRKLDGDVYSYIDIEYYSDPIAPSAVSKASKALEKNRIHLTGTLDKSLNKIGFYTTNEKKNYMALTLNNRLINGTICFHHNFFTTTTNFTPSEMRQKLHDELSNYMVEVVLNKNGDPISHKYSGKSSNGKTKDDLPMSLMILDMAHEMWLKQATENRHNNERDIANNPANITSGASLLEPSLLYGRYNNTVPYIF